MKDTLTSRNHVDFRQRYQGTFGFLLVDEKKLLVNIVEVGEKQVVFVDKNKTEYYAYRDGGSIFEFIQVQRGWFNTLKGVYYLARIPARQWHRGICANNTTIHLLSEDKMRNLPINIHNLATVFETPLETNAAFNQFVDKEQTAFALTKHFAMDRKHLYFDDRTVGDIQTGNATVALGLKTDIIRQELGDAIRRSALPITLL
jgi:hypothetical protein